MAKDGGEVALQSFPTTKELISKYSTGTRPNHKHKTIPWMK